MTTRDELIEAVRDPGFAYCPDRHVFLVVDNILEHHAHELAEKIRASHHVADGHPCPGKYCVGRYAADLIDPEVEQVTEWTTRDEIRAGLLNGDVSPYASLRSWDRAKTEADTLIDQLLAEHAHELAEKIRQHDWHINLDGYYDDTPWDAANLIDPEVDK